MLPKIVDENPPITSNTFPNEVNVAPNERITVNTPRVTR